MQLLEDADIPDPCASKMLLDWLSYCDYKCLLQAICWNKAPWLEVLPRCLKGRFIRILCTYMYRYMHAIILINACTCV